MDDPGAHSRIYKPLADLKYQYQPHSQPSTIQAVASTEFPRIKQKDRRDRDSYGTRSYRLSNVINDILKMKLEYGHIHDQISLIDLHMKEESAKHEKAVLKHDHFVDSFERFLSRQYEQVKGILSDLARHERDSDSLRDKLSSLRQLVVQKSLEIHELEKTWRRFQVSQKFLVHIAALLRRTDSVPETFRNFNVDPANKTPSLDELVANFEYHDDGQCFDETDFQHVTAARILDFLSKLKQQNMMLLRYKHEYEWTKDNLSNSKMNIESQLHERENTLVRDVEEIKKQIEDVNCEVETVQTLYQKEVLISESQAREAGKLKDFVEAIYERCFGPAVVRKSHLQMVKFVEKHCLELLGELSSFEPHILKKVLRK